MTLLLCILVIQSPVKISNNIYEIPILIFFKLFINKKYARITILYKLILIISKSKTENKKMYEIKYIK